jgi:tRNA A-37 threonylcarbamoyl transferase component Bud32
MSDLRGRLQETLGGAYTLDRELRGGGMSRVFVAHDEGLDRDVVIKVLTPELAATLSAQRFTREIKLAAALQEPHIVPLLSAGLTGDGLPFYTMPFLRGDSLRARMTAGRVPLAESAGILRNVAQALAHAHAKGVVHRDIKPENVLLSSGTAVVTDFGIAKALAVSKTEAPGGTLTQAGTSLGTPAYMAPEQAAGDDVDERADLYAWGLIAYELLAGHHPFHDRKTTQQLLAAQIAERPKDLLDLLAAEDRRDPAARALATLAMQCLEKLPESRPASVAALVAAMDARRAARPMRRSRRVALAVGGLVLLAVAITAYALTRSSAPPLLLEPKRVAVATFENRSGDPSLDPLGVMAADWIARGLVGTGLVDVGGTAADLAARGVTSGAGQSAVLTLARNANAGIVISGAYYRQGDSVLFQADFTDANAGKLVQTVGPVAARASAPLIGVELLRQRVIGSLAPFVDSTLSSLAAVTSRPPSLEAYREFLAGQDLFYRDQAAAVDRFARAAAADSTYQFPLMWELVALSSLGDEARADSLTHLLESRRNRLAPYEQAYLDYAKCRMAPGISTCVPSTAALLRFTPKSQFMRYLHGIMLRWTNKPNAADSMFRNLDPMSGELRGRIQFVIHHAGVLHDLSQHDRELAVIRAGQPLYSGRLSFAFSAIRPLVALGRLDEVDRAVDDAFTLPSETRGSAAQTGALTMYELRWHGHSSVADSLGARLLARLDARPPAEAPTAEGRRGRAMLLMAARRWSELHVLADSMEVANPGNVEALRLRGVARAMQGQRAEAAAIEHALELDTRPIRPEDGCQFLRVCRRTARAYIAAALGDKARAVSLIDGWVFRDFNPAHFDLLGELLRDYPPFQELIKPGG